MNSQSVEKTEVRASQNTKESAAATDVAAKKTNQGGHATNSSTVGTDGKAKQAAKESTTEKCPGAKNAASGSQKTNSEQKQSSSVVVGQEYEQSSTKEENVTQAATPGNLTTNADQNAQHTPLAKNVTLHLILAPDHLKR